MDPQHIIDTCESNWDANKSDCNHFVKAVADSLGVTLFAAGDDADTILNKLSNAAGWPPIPGTPDLSTVETDAAAGQFIIAGLRSNEFTPPRTHGHVVVVVKGDDPLHPGYPLAYWGTLGGVGQKDSSIRNTFIPDTDLPNVKYYGTSLPDAATMHFIGQLAGLTRPDSLAEVKATIESLTTTLVSSIGTSYDGDQKDRVFFPNGVEKIEIEVKVGAIDVSVKVVGPKAT
jgi:hypothetical protein